jgi:hypothetical protein
MGHPIGPPSVDPGRAVSAANCALHVQAIKQPPLTSALCMDRPDEAFDGHSSEATLRLGWYFRPVLAGSCRLVFGFGMVAISIVAVSSSSRSSTVPLAPAGTRSIDAVSSTRSKQSRSLAACVIVSALAFLGDPALGGPEIVSTESGIGGEVTVSAQIDPEGSRNDIRNQACVLAVACQPLIGNF